MVFDVLSKQSIDMKLKTEPDSNSITELTFSSIFD